MRLRPTDIATREIGDTVMILDLGTGRYHSVGGSGTVLLELLAGDVTEEQLVDALVGTYAVDRELAARDVRAFLADLDANGLLQR